MMHEDSPKMSVAQGLAVAASTSQPRSEIVFEGAVEYEMVTEAKPAENIQLEIKIPYVEPTAGTYSTSLLYHRVIKHDYVLHYIHNIISITCSRLQSDTIRVI